MKETALCPNIVGSTRLNDWVDPECEGEKLETPADPLSRNATFIHGSGKVGTRRSKKNVHPSQVVEVARIAYNNINGQDSNLWDEVQERVCSSKSDILCLTETHWRQGGDTGDITGFKRFLKCRDFYGKRGSGVAIFIKDDWSSHEWEGPNDDGVTSEELLWVVISTASGDIAIGTVFFGQNKDKLRNDELEERLHSDISQLKSENKTVVGDFNGHKERGIKGQGIRSITDRNGQRVLGLINQYSLCLLNSQENICTGTWTWRRRESKSIIDYAMISNDKQGQVQSMVIEDKGPGLATASDHSCIDVEIKIESPALRKRSMSQRNDGISTGKPTGYYLKKNYSRDWKNG